MLVNVYEAKAQLSSLIDKATKGEEVILGKAGIPLVKLVPYKASDPLKSRGMFAGKIDIAEDFDETPEWLIDGFEGK